MKRFHYALILATALWQTNATAQSVEIGGEIRTRSELRDGFKEPLPDDFHAAFVSNLRTRLKVGYSNENIRARITLQDTRTYGSTAPGKTGNGVGILEAWGEYAFTDNFSFVLGRQQLEYDDKRLFSASNWSNTGNAHDALLLKYRPGDFNIHLGGAWNNESDVNYEKQYDITYKTLLYTWLNRRFDLVDVSAIYVNESFQKGDTPELIKERYYRNTIGANLALDDKDLPLYLYATFYHQFGHDKSGRKLNANLAAFRAEYTFQATISALAGVDYLSGTAKDADPDKNNTFNKLYGTNHAFNGSMEYWTTPPTQGLVDLYAGITVKPIKKLKINGTYHHFSTAKEIAGTDKKNIGSEFDLTVDYSISSGLALQGGWSSYFTTSSTDLLKGTYDVDTHFPQWAYLMLTLKF